MNSNKPQTNFTKPKVKNSGNSLMFYTSLLLLAGFIILLLIFLVQYLRTPCGPPGKMNYWNYLAGFDPTIPPCNPPLPEKDFEQRERTDEREVFHISDQIYSRDDSKEKCRAYDAELASYQQLKKFYNDGGSFANYGWGKDGNAYQVIQPCDYVKLRREGVNIGPPGINGGKFDPNFRVGVTCFGIKPAGETIQLKDPYCGEKNEICVRNPGACSVLDTDKIAPFIPNKQWSQWGDK